jgi:5'-3' exonuclease
MRRIAKTELDNTLKREDLSTIEKNKLAEEMMVKEAKRIAETKQKRKVENYVDNVQLGVDGWKMRYYTNKFLITDPVDVAEFVQNIKQSYIEGL